MPLVLIVRTSTVSLAFVLAACASAPPAPLPEDHPANPQAAAAPLPPPPAALTAYRDFRVRPADAQSGQQDPVAPPDSQQEDGHEHKH